MEDKEAFLKRWSRLKQETVKQEISKSEGKAQASAQNSPAPELPPLDKLDLDADFSGFMHPKVEEGLRRAALKKLFSDPRFHFDNMDKLDTYIDDYGIPDPISPGMLARLMESNPLLFPPKEEVSKSAEGQEKPAEVPPPEKNSRQLADEMLPPGDEIQKTGQDIKLGQNVLDKKTQ
ncbi:MAG: DUF3306 domain-containing protein [Burkholderiales bacterium]